MCRNFLPRLVLTFELKGGLYHVMFLVRFLLFFGAFSCGGLYANLWSYPLSVRAFWQGAIDSSNTSLLDEMQQGTAIVNKIYIYIYCLLSN